MSIIDETPAEFDEEPTIDKYAELARRFALYPGHGNAIETMYCALGLSGEAGEVAGKLSKAIRDDRWPLVESKGMGEPDEFVASITSAGECLRPARREQIIDEVGDVFWFLANLCRELGVEPSEACRRNLAKLADRNKRDAIKGSGDDR